MTTATLKICAFCETYFGSTKKVGGITRVNGCLSCKGYTEDVAEAKLIKKFFEKRIKLMESFKADIDEQIKQEKEKADTIETWLKTKE